MSVYFIERPSDGAIKIGFTKDPFTRVVTLSKALGEALTLKKITNGARLEEREYHKQFAAYRVDGEWFAPHDELESLMDTLPAHPCNKREMLQTQRKQRSGPPVADLIEAFQQKMGIKNYALARQIGISASTLSRLKHGTLPDADGLAKIVLWMTKEAK